MLVSGDSTDLKYMLKQEPKSEEAKKELQDIEARMKADPGLPEEPGDKLPHPDDLPWTLLSESETEDCKHAGNYTPCRFYNHYGCAKGAECTFSHAPDAKSVRDEMYAAHVACLSKPHIDRHFLQRKECLSPFSHWRL